jgi:hypothetical protein
MSDDDQQPQFGAEMELVMPFTVAASQGGPYEDAAFTAGWHAGELSLAMQTLASIGGTLTRAVPTPLVPQIDLIAMRHGYQVRAVPWPEDPEAWTTVTIHVGPGPERGRDA